MAIDFKDLSDQELLYGQKTCPGCAATIAVRLALKILGERTFVCVPACCVAATTNAYPQMSFFVNNVVTAFPATGATIAGMAAAAETQGLEDVTILGVAGDGGTADIGLQALSGACERNDNLIYLCYDNEAYMNTGIQRSGSTPWGAWTTTSPAGEGKKGEVKFRKNLFDIITAHRVPYCATASVAYPRDLMEKVAKAKSIKGAKFIHVQAPCPTGWGYPSEKTIEYGRLAVESGLWYLAEYENGKNKLNLTPKTFKPVELYLRGQRRFRHLTEEDYRLIERHRDLEWELLKKRVNV
ncbi:MAG: pyruvate ferredoxin oxidoreductase [Synergistaceae bacterium]|jgi:pyruvate ferredoxin oxidoreductase beta subunit|nr:pyruvate ferredoxin oxidoreductase [Synergistaceae bacterium]